MSVGQIQDADPGFRNWCSNPYYSACASQTRRLKLNRNADFWVPCPRQDLLRDPRVSLYARSRFLCSAHCTAVASIAMTYPSQSVTPDFSLIIIKKKILLSLEAKILIMSPYLIAFNNNVISIYLPVFILSVSAVVLGPECLCVNEAVFWLCQLLIIAACLKLTLAGSA